MRSISGSSKCLFAVVLLAAFLCLPLSQGAWGAEYVIKVGTIVSESHPDFVSLTNVFKPKIEKESGGRVEVQLYPNGQLGGDREMTESVQMGTLTMALPATSILAGFEKKFQVLDLPFLFKDKATGYKALDGELGKTLDDLLPQHGFVNLGYCENGFRHVTNNRGPITKPEDLKGMKLRIMENPMHIAAFKLLGANPTPMSYGEVYTALQQGTVDGQENPIAIVADGKFYEVQKYYSLTGHVFSVIMLLANKDFMDKLPEDLKKLVAEAATEFLLADRKLIDSEEASLLKTMEEQGLQVNTLTPEQKQVFIDATLPVYEQFKDVLGEDIIELAKKANAES
ncbi:MAG: DctP family TRAP transporter solute-binding subunit [Synergistaceae bacterium]|jgi:tripartite ATP-independent transporter DctP family solute receptor|nr:DctP family TRAP transporter solute-binding subunit [Synergistaceae bacterium]